MAKRDKLAGVHPELVEKHARIRAAMQILGFPMLVTDGIRTEAEQRALYEKGRTTAGPTVTDMDGSPLKRSKHQDGLAIDACFLDQRAQPTWDLHYPWEAYGECAKALGLVWGGDWKRRDCPHVELPIKATPSAGTRKAR